MRPARPFPPLRLSRPLRLLICTVCAVAALTVSTSGQTMNRLKGRVVLENGDPIADVDVHMEALYGFNAGDYVGQRTYTAKTNAKGEWSVVGLKAGIWVFDVTAPGRLTAAVALPINLVTSIGSGASALMLPWQLVLKPGAPIEGDVGRMLMDASAALAAHDADKVRMLMSSVPSPATVEYLNGAGQVCLAAHEAGLASPLFQQAIQKDPSSFQAVLGFASSSLMRRDFDSASRAFAAARDRTKDKDEQKYLSAAIGDLAKIMVPTK